MKSSPKDPVAILGPKNTYSDLAAQKYAGKKPEAAYCASIGDVFKMVASGKVKQGIVPLENTIHGAVRETLEELNKKIVHIVAKLNLPIRHALVAMKETRKKDILSISSHDQALAQCGKYLRKHFPRARLLQTSSTMAAFEAIKSGNNTCAAAIIPYEIAKKLDCAILADQIGDNPKNSTTFIVIENPAALSSS